MCRCNAASGTKYMLLKLWYEYRRTESKERQFTHITLCFLIVRFYSFIIFIHSILFTLAHHECKAFVNMKYIKKPMGHISLRLADRKIIIRKITCLHDIWCADFHYVFLIVHLNGHPNCIDWRCIFFLCFVIISCLFGVCETLCFRNVLILLYHHRSVLITVISAQMNTCQYQDDVRVTLS